MEFEAGWYKIYKPVICALLPLVLRHYIVLTVGCDCSQYVSGFSQDFVLYNLYFCLLKLQISVKQNYTSFSRTSKNLNFTVIYHCRCSDTRGKLSRGNVIIVC